MIVWVQWLFGFVIDWPVDSDWLLGFLWSGKWLQALDEFATKLIEGEHYASDDVAQRRDQLLHRRNLLYEKSARRRQQLELSYQFQLFERDCDETKGWINEKLKTASDESYLVGWWSCFPPAHV